MAVDLKEFIDNTNASYASLCNLMMCALWDNAAHIHRGWTKQNHCFIFCANLKDAQWLWGLKSGFMLDNDWNGF